MSRITQEIAHRVARKLLSSHLSKVEEAKEAYRKLATDEYRSYIPIEVMDTYVNHSEWVRSVASIQVDGDGFSYERIALVQNLPSNYCESYGILNLTPVFASKLQQAKRKYEKLRDEYKQLLSETETALITLRTYKRVEEKLPEAYKFLPTPPMPVAINLDNIRKKINKQ